uniref:Uncharacterized protein n=1 Tax=Leersia perrieri TaxID=77586 RepID=A0A0D9WGA8_9ORYZ
MPPLASDARACTDRTPTSPTKTGSLQAAPFDCYPLILPLSRSLPQISQIQCSSRPVSTAAGVCVYAAEEVLQRYQIRPVLTRSRPPAGGSGGAAVASLLARLGLAAAMLARLWCCYPLLSPSGIVCRRCSPVPLFPLPNPSSLPLQDAGSSSGFCSVGGKLPIEGRRSPLPSQLLPFCKLVLSGCGSFQGPPRCDDVCDVVESELLPTGSSWRKPCPVDPVLTRTTPVGAVFLLGGVISSSKLAVAILSNCTTLVAEQEVLGCEVHQKAQ